MYCPRRAESRSASTSYRKGSFYGEYVSTGIFFSNSILKACILHPFWFQRKSIYSKCFHKNLVHVSISEPWWSTVKWKRAFVPHGRCTTIPCTPTSWRTYRTSSTNSTTCWHIKVRNYDCFNYTVKPLFKKFTQRCVTYEPTNCCVRKLHNLYKILHKLCTILHKLCNFLTQQLVGSYVTQRCVNF